MNIRSATPNDLPSIEEIDCVIESAHYLHIDRAGDGPEIHFKLEQRPLREKLIAPNLLDDEIRFTLQQVVTGGDEGIAQVAEHDDRVVAIILAQARTTLGTMEVLDLRVDCDSRREGLATVLLYQLIQMATEQQLRAVSILTQTNNAPAAALLGKLGFILSGLDTRRHSNHDLVKEAATLMWYYEIK